jgi:hypothetical protein
VDEADADIKRNLARILGEKNTSSSASSSLLSLKVLEGP